MRGTRAAWLIPLPLAGASWLGAHCLPIGLSRLTETGIWAPCGTRSRVPRLHTRTCRLEAGAPRRGSLAPRRRGAEGTARDAPAGPALHPAGARRFRRLGTPRASGRNRGNSVRPRARADLRRRDGPSAPPNPARRRWALGSRPPARVAVGRCPRRARPRSPTSGSDVTAGALRCASRRCHRHRRSARRV